MERETRTYDFYTGPQLLVDEPSLVDEVACLLQACFPTIFKGLSPRETLQEGIGFHDMPDTTWILLRTQNPVLTKISSSMPLIIGIATTIQYHTGMYVCNLCVSPTFQGRGLGLDLLEAAAGSRGDIPKRSNENEDSNTKNDANGRSTSTVLLSKGRLIGHADANNGALLEYYSRLGAKVVQTGMGNATCGVSDLVKAPTTAMSGARVRLEREIPTTADELCYFFQSIRNDREKRRHTRYWTKIRWLGAVAVFCTGSVTIVLVTLCGTGNRRR